MIVNEIFTSIDGEVNEYYQGRLTTFIRLAGCNLRCSYCDTQYAQSKDQGKEMSIEQIKNKIYKLGLNKITITGGEPLLQYDELADLIFNLQSDDKRIVDKITVETNGSIKAVRGYLRSFVSWIVDWKLSSSGMSDKMKIENFSGLNERDWVKFVIADYNDYDEALGVMHDINYGAPHVNFAFSPMYGRIKAKELLGWMIMDRVDAVLNLQLHKIADLK